MKQWTLSTRKLYNFLGNFSEKRLLLSYVRRKKLAPQKKMLCQFLKPLSLSSSVVPDPCLPLCVLLGLGLRFSFFSLMFFQFLDLTACDVQSFLYYCFSFFFGFCFASTATNLQHFNYFLMFIFLRIYFSFFFSFLRITCSFGILCE